MPGGTELNAPAIDHSFSEPWITNANAAVDNGDFYAPSRVLTASKSHRPPDPKRPDCMGQGPPEQTESG